MTIPSRSDQTARVQDCIADLMERRRYGPWDMFAVKLALEEALANAIKHGNAQNPSKKVRVRFDVGDQAVRLQVEDEGDGFRVEDVPDPTAPENLDKPTGRGIFLMRKYMTSVAYNARGNCVTMRKLRSNTPDEPSAAISRLDDGDVLQITKLAEAFLEVDAIPS